MPPALTFHPADGSITIEGSPVVIGGGMSIDITRDALREFASEPRDMKNGHEGVALRGLSLAGYPCILDLGFFRGALTSVSWRIVVSQQAEDYLPVEPRDEEIRVVTGILSKTFDRPFSTGHESLHWGDVWSYRTLQGGERAEGGLVHANRATGPDVPSFDPKLLFGFVVFVGLVIRACR